VVFVRRRTNKGFEIGSMGKEEEKEEKAQKGKGEKIPLTDALQNRALKNMYGFKK
jgi:hypothetical protein